VEAVSVVVPGPAQQQDGKALPVSNSFNDHKVASYLRDIISKKMFSLLIGKKKSTAVLAQ
jgi:hypothetical protein